MEQTIPLIAWLPPALAVAGVVIGLVADAFERRGASVAVMAATLLGAGGVGFYLSLHTEPAIVLGVLMTGAGFTSMPALGYTLAGLAVVAGFRRYAGLDRGPAMAALVSTGALFSHMMLASLDLMVLFVALSGLAIVGYSLVAGAGTRRAEESAVRYFVSGAVATGLTVYGLALMFGLGAGTTEYASVTAGIGQAGGRPALLTLGLVLAAFAFKLGAFPFHTWVPDAYEHADAPSAAFLSSAPKIAGVMAVLVLVRGTVFSSPVFAPSANLLVALGIGSLAFGSLGMLRQRSVARMLGYSGIAQVGYALLAIGAGDGGIRASVIFVVTYAVAACAAFAALEAIGRARPGWDGTLDGMAGIARRSPVLGVVLTVIMLSLTGIPLFAGFWGKLHVFVALVQSGSVWVAVGAGVAAVVSFGGYGAVVRAAYFDEEEPAGRVDADADAPGAAALAGREDEAAAAERGGSPLVVAVLLAVVIVVVGVMPLATGFAPLYTLFSL